MATSKIDRPRAKPLSLLGILPFLWRYPRQVALSVFLLLVSIAIELTLPQILGSAITDLRWQVQWGTTYDGMAYVLLFTSLVLVRAGVGYILGPIRNGLAQRTLNDIRAAIYDAAQCHGFGFHDRSNTGELISRSTSDVSNLQDFLFACLFLSVDIGISLVVSLGLIFSVSPASGWVAFLTIAPTIGLIALYASKLQPRWRQVHDLHGAMTSVVQENIAGVRVVKAFAQEPGQVAKFRLRRDQFLTTLSETVSYWAARVPFAQFIYGLSTPLVLWVGGGQVLRGELSLGDLAKTIFYLMAIGHRVGQVGQFTNIIQNASSSAERILEIINEPRLIKSGKRDLPSGRGVVVFDHVDFNYQKGRACLMDVSFRAEPGLTTAIVGPTGSGKTTLINLIPRFYDVSRGRVLVNGIDVRELNLVQLRRDVGIIFQDTFLFSTTVSENIAYGKPGATREEIQAAAREAQAHEFISELEAGYETMVGERGVSLSGGQKQRIAIARAFLMNPRILIMDDATASIDVQMERLIREGMRRLCQGRTTFTIAHRLSTLQHADQILVLKAGSIAERGSHDELMARGGLYWEIIEGQINPSMPAKEEPNGR